MKHLHKSTGLEFECGELMETSNEVLPDGTRRTYDITVITLWRDPSEDEALPPVLVNFYFGEYNPEYTDHYIDQWLKQFKDCKDIIDAYWLTNSDVLEEPLRSKALNALDAVNTVAEVLQLGGDM